VALAEPDRATADGPNPAADGPGPGPEGPAGLPRWFWPSFAAPATVWLLLLFAAPFYVILCVAFGSLNPIFLTPLPQYNPLRWRFGTFLWVVRQIFKGGSVFQADFGHTLAYVAIATTGTLVIGYPVAYFISRHAGRFRVAFLAALLAPFWISYMMRMLAWISLLEPDGYVNRILSALHLTSSPTAWLDGRPATVMLGLVYGYAPYMILVLFGALDRIDRSLLEAARDLGLGQARVFWRVTVPLTRQAILAGCVIVSLPMFGDYFTQSLLAGTRNTAMVGNLIEGEIQSSLVAQGASLVIVMLVLLAMPMLYYTRSTAQARRVLGT
jgi:ABC-type spermidine/putrescine transport system permease subunit I